MTEFETSKGNPNEPTSFEIFGKSLLLTAFQAHGDWISVSDRDGNVLHAVLTYGTTNYKVRARRDQVLNNKQTSELVVEQDRDTSTSRRQKLFHAQIVCAVNITTGEEEVHLRAYFLGSVNTLSESERKVFLNSFSKATFNPNRTQIYETELTNRYGVDHVSRITR